MKILSDSIAARTYLKNGAIIAYPTEAVYGLGCDPFNQQVITTLLALKQRESSKGLILLISNWSQLTPLIEIVPDACLAAVKATWPGPVTWVFPKSSLIPNWLSGDYPTIAIRMSAHPVAQALCVDGPIVSTSANIGGRNPALDIADLCMQFPRGIDVLLSGDLGAESQPSRIYDVLSGACLR